MKRRCRCLSEARVGDPEAEGFIDSKGRFYPAAFFNHNKVAKKLLTERGMPISEEAKQAALKTEWQPPVMELLRQNWVRQYHCEFTVWALNRTTAWGVHDGAAKQTCRPVIVEECGRHGCRGERRYADARALVDEAEGLAGFRRR